jgi:hypothetical protein
LEQRTDRFDRLRALLLGGSRDTRGCPGRVPETL